MSKDLVSCSGIQVWVWARLLVAWSFGSQQDVNAPIEGWRTMFIVVGIVSGIVGFATFVFVPNTPIKARFLCDNEKIAILIGVLTEIPRNQLY